MMDIKELNKISIKAYLADKGINPVKDKGYYGMYHSPFREDSNASMKVDYDKNLWIDFGSNDGGTMIDLVMRMNNCTAKEAIATLEQMYERYNVSTNQRHSVPTDSFSFHGSLSMAIVIQNVQPLSNPALLDYLKERHINLHIVQQHCKEVYYSVSGKDYFAIGFPNDSGGYELRNKYFKGCTSKDNTINNKGCESCLVFEGFMDYLSFLTLKDIESAKQSVVILNSVANLSKAIGFIQSHENIYTYLDNDEAGKKTTQQIKSSCPNSIISDQSAQYSKFKDLNDFLISTKQAQKAEQQRKPSRGFRL